MQTVDRKVGGLDSGMASIGVRSALECIRSVAEVRMVRNECCVSAIYDAYRVHPRQFETAVRVMGCEVERLDLRSAGVNRLPENEAVEGPVKRSGHEKE